MRVDLSSADPLTWWTLTSPTAIHVADVFRWFVTFGALILAAMVWRFMWTRRDLPARLAAGVFATVCCFAASATEYDRLHQPVNVRLPLFVVGTVAGFVWQWQANRADYQQRMSEVRERVARVDPR